MTTAKIIIREKKKDRTAPDKSKMLYARLEDKRQQVGLENFRKNLLRYYRETAKSFGGTFLKENGNFIFII